MCPKTAAQRGSSLDVHHSRVESASPKHVINSTVGIQTLYKVSVIGSTGHWSCTQPVGRSSNRGGLFAFQQSVLRHSLASFYDEELASHDPALRERFWKAVIAEAATVP